MHKGVWSMRSHDLLNGYLGHNTLLPRDSVVQDVRVLVAPQDEDDLSDAASSSVLDRNGLTASSLSRSALTALSSPSRSLDDEDLRNTVLSRSVGMCPTLPDVLDLGADLAGHQEAVPRAPITFDSWNVIPQRAPPRPRRLNRLYINPASAAPPVFAHGSAGCASRDGLAFRTDGYRERTSPSVGREPTVEGYVTAVEYSATSFTFPRLEGGRDGGLESLSPNEAQHKPCVQPRAPCAWLDNGGTCGTDRATPAPPAPGTPNTRAHTSAAHLSAAAAACETAWTAPAAAAFAPPPGTAQAATAADAAVAVASSQLAVGMAAKTFRQNAVRSRVSMKLHSAEPEQLQPGTLAALGRLLLPRGWLLTGAAVRRGCIELVLDYSRMDCQEHADNPAEEVRAAEHSVSLGVPDWQVAELMSCLREQGVFDPAAEPRVGVQVDERLHHVQWQWQQEWVPPAPSTGEDRGSALGGLAWSGDGVRLAADADWRCTAVAAGCAPSAGAVPLVEPVCIVARCHGQGTDTAAAITTKPDTSAASGTSANDAGGLATGDTGSAILRVQLPDKLSDAYGCSVRCLGRFLPVAELRCPPCCCAAADATTRTDPQKHGVDGAYWRVDRTQRDSTGLVSVAAAATGATVSACTFPGEATSGGAVVLRLVELPACSALLQLEVRRGAAQDTGSAGESSAQSGLRESDHGLQAHTAGPCTSAVSEGDGGEGMVTASPPTCLAGHEWDGQVVQLQQEGASPHPEDAGAHDHLLPAVPVLLLRACACAAAANTEPAAVASRNAGGGGGGGGASRLRDRTDSFTQRPRRAGAAACCCHGAWPEQLAVGAAQELCDLRNRITQAAGTGVEAAEGQALAAASEFLFDLGLLLDAVSCVDAVSCAGEAQLEGQETRAGSFRVHDGGESAGAGWSVAEEVQAWLREQLGSAAGGDDGHGGAEGQTSAAAAVAALRRHLADVAVTLLAGCAELSLPTTAQLLDELATSRLQLVDREALVLAAADGDAGLAARLRVWLSRPLVTAAASTLPAASAPLGAQQPDAASLQQQPSLRLSVSSNAIDEPAAAQPEGCADERGEREHSRHRGPHRYALSDPDAAEPSTNAATVATQPAAGSTDRSLRPTLPRGFRSVRTPPAAAVAVVKELGRHLVACCTGFGTPALERAFWMDTAGRMQSACRLCALLTLITVFVAALRALLEDGPAAAAFMLLYQGGQAALLACFGRWGNGSAGRLFGTVVAVTALRCGCHVAMVAGLAPVPSFARRVCRAGVDLVSETVPRGVVELVPLWLFAALLLCWELPAAYMLYGHIDGNGQGLLTRSIPLRLAAFAVLKAGANIGAQAVRRRRFEARNRVAKAQ